MSSKAFFLKDDLYAYVARHSVRETPEQRALREETARHPRAGMQTAPDQVQLLALLARVTGVRRYLEVGVFTGYSALGVALALPTDGRVVACDVSEEYIAVGRNFWRSAGVENKIDVRIGPAAETLDRMLANGQAATFDMAYIDADKTNYDAYYERSLRLVRPNGLIAIDNVLWSGEVLNESSRDPDTQALRALNDKIAADDRVDAVMLTIGDGLTIARKR